MSTVVARLFTSTPARDALATWEAIVALLTRGADDDNRKELLSVAGIAASVITEKSAKDAAIVVTCDGPRTRIYCLYDDAAIEGDDANEEPLSFNPLKGEWTLSLPCPADDLDWVNTALRGRSSRITARDAATSAAVAKESATAAQSLELDTEGFLGS